MAREIHDHYFKQAKREGYRSRAAYKLIEIDDRRKVLRRGDRVLDCGCAPGSWLQVAAQRVGAKGVVVGIDLQPVQRPTDAANVHVIEGDVTTITAAELLAAAHVDEHRFDVIVSDMAPKTTGDRNMDHHASVRLCHAVLDRCGDLLTPGGVIVMKVFEGAAYADLLERTRAMFEKVKGFSPKASRQESTEIYVVAHGYRGADSGVAPEATSELEIELPKRRPSTGWG
jgi:23S rRNA (uridine2552-2'-O)-methyltransferase